MNFRFSLIGIQGGLTSYRGHLMSLGAVSLLASFLFTACHLKSGQGPAAMTPASVERGRIIYQTQCIACHNPNPRKPGSIGPEIFKSSRELLEARILHGNYPPGYTPKRQTHSMVALPHLKHEIDSLHAFLNIIE